MVSCVKDHFFAGHRVFQSIADLNHHLEQWLDEEANRRRHRTHSEIIRERFQRDEQPAFTTLPRQRFDTAYLDYHQVAWDGYVEVRGNRYSAPDALCGQTVRIRVTLDDESQVIDAQERIVAEHLLALPDAGWQRQANHHRRLWREALQGEQRGLEIYEEVTEQLLQQLKFDHLADQLETVCEQAASRDLFYREFLVEALQCEWAGRHRRGIDSRIKQARLPWLKTLEQFDFDFQPSIDRKVVRQLSGLARFYPAGGNQAATAELMQRFPSSTEPQTLYIYLYKNPSFRHGLPQTWNEFLDWYPTEKACLAFIFEKTRTPLRVWLAGAWYMTNQKLGVSTHTPAREPPL